ncbi:nucleotide-diphospho-sugar transferase [Pontibacter sp. KCTC 32443]|uniref:nucleotide-diphospho-sugar transferase n=1 Tax=Pontibacter TaxID=323449 RepID=UPI00164D0F39|nr:MULTISPECIES: nucleotide-diphospho-sugar transferase [Pontibacter]MBC5773500.1 nucleotide-diphospho-sugar transferase [Pontibacter sp. KCTC 32443]
MVNSPILFLAFNRPEETAVVFEAIRIASPQKLYIALDGPRESNCNDITNYALVKNIVSEVSWNCEVKYLIREKNLGCFRAVSSAIKWFFDQEEQGIILEDDCLPSQDFFIFCDEMLRKYKNDYNVISINGSNFGFDDDRKHSYFFTNYMNMWGWATWRRSVDLVDYELKHWKQMKHKNLYLFLKLFKQFKSFDWDWVQYLRFQFDRIINNDIDTWDYQWLFAQIDNEKLSVVPSRNLVTNIGFGVNANHTVDVNSPANNLPAKKLNFPLKHPKKYYKIKLFERDYVKGVWANRKRKSTFLQFKTMLKYYLNKI